MYKFNHPGKLSIPGGVFDGRDERRLSAERQKGDRGLCASRSAGERWRRRQPPAGTNQRTQTHDAQTLA